MRDPVMPRLSAIVITHNEEEMLPGCLASLAFCDEIVIVDRGSTDGTLGVAEAAGARVLTRAWTGFGDQKNAALAAARGAWVLSLDADERVPEALRAEILAALAAPSAEGYAMPRRSTFLGRPMRHSGWWPDRVVRLFRRGAARFSDDVVHERVLVQGRVGRLAAALDHHPVRTLQDALAKRDRYVALGARRLADEGRRTGFGAAVARGGFAFLRTYVLRLGFLDGREGFMLAVLNAETTYYRYLTAWLAERPPRP